MAPSLLTTLQDDERDLVFDTFDEVVAWVAPALLGAGRSAVADLGITTVADLIRLDVDDVAVVGGDIRVTGRPIHRPSPPPHPLGAS